MTPSTRLTVNGRHQSVESDPLTPLCGILRDVLVLRSVREPCGVGACGACTVLVDSRPVKSCLLALGLVGDAEVTTAEGLARDDPIVIAFARRNAFQCGYCIPGFVLTVRGLLAAEPAPTLAAIRDALAGNLCRCGSYGPILEAVDDLLAVQDPHVAPAAG